MKKIIILAVVIVLLGVALASAEDMVSLELTYPVGASPRVFTSGWVFGARAIANQQDISDQVQWSGSGEFYPDKGPVSRPVFTIAGPNTIKLSVIFEGKTYEKSFGVDAVTPFSYAKVGDQAQCLNDVHGCPACPHNVIGPITNGSNTVFINGKPAARVGDRGTHVACCGPNTFEIIEGDPNVLIDGKPAARIGSKTKHCGGIGKIIGVKAPFYVVFKMTFPMVRPERKPKRGPDESEQEWARRRAAVYNAMGMSDFEFKDFPVAEKPFVASFSEGATDIYSLAQFESGSKWVLPVNAGQVSGSILLTVVGNYSEFVDAIRFVPELKAVKDLKVTQFTKTDGKSNFEGQGASALLGPLEKREWNANDKAAAVRLSKVFHSMFDCFITSVAYGYDNSKIEIFRQFRDQVLMQSEVGAYLANLYYEVGPKGAEFLRRHPEYLPAARFILDKIALQLRKLDLE